MKFAKWAYLIAAIYGLLVITPLYFLESKIGIDSPPAINHPEYYYGFIGVTLAWQVAFLMISGDPKRYRLLMLASVVEKYSWGLASLVLFWQGRIAMPVLVLGVIDLILGAFFAISYKKTAE